MKIMMMGAVGSGKTSLSQRFLGEELNYKKTQSVEIIGNAIDTPGEYIENKKLLHALIVTGTDADMVFFIQDPTSKEHYYSPGQVTMFQCPVIGIISKIDIATKEQIDWAAEILEFSGVSKIFKVSNETKEGIPELMQYLDSLEG